MTLSSISIRQYCRLRNGGFHCGKPDGEKERACSWRLWRSMSLGVGELLLPHSGHMRANWQFWGCFRLGYGTVKNRRPRSNSDFLGLVLLSYPSPSKYISLLRLNFAVGYAAFLVTTIADDYAASGTAMRLPVHGGSFCGAHPLPGRSGMILPQLFTCPSAISVSPPPNSLLRTSSCVTRI